MGTVRSALLVAVVASALAGCAQADPGEDGPPSDGPIVLMTPGPQRPVPEPGPLPPEMLTLPLVTSEMHAVLDEVQARWGEHPDLGQSEISLDRSLIILRWHGTPPAELTALAASRDGETFDVRVDETRFRNSELAEEAGRLVREHRGEVTSAGPRVAGDGIMLGLDPSVAAKGPDELGITSRFPLFPEAMAPPVAISAG